MKPVQLSDGRKARYFFRYHIDKRTGTHEQTDCEIVNADTKEEIVHNHVVRYKWDLDNKKLARKHAFDAAVKLLPPIDHALLWKHFMANQRI